MVQGEGDCPVRAGATNRRKPPAWVVPFLRALERTGEARGSARDAGIDHTTAYVRRRTHADFAAAWRAALAAHAAAVKAREAEELEALRAAPPRPGPLAHGQAETDLVGGARQLKRAGHDRWGPRKEKRFFDELAATANITRAAAAAGVSPNAVHARRLRNAHFRAKWAAVIEVGKAEIDMHLVETAKRSFDPAKDLDLGEVRPKVTIAEAIRITQGRGSRKPGPLPDAYGGESAPMPADDVDEVRERILGKLRRLRQRDIADKIAKGWSHDEEHGRVVPPGWVRAKPE